MSATSLSDPSKKRRDIDIAMLATHTEGGGIAMRPMSNNGELDHDGDPYYFTWAAARMVADIERDPRVALSFRGDRAFLVAVEGRAELVREKAAFRDHWTRDLDRWFPDGIDTDGLVMIRVRATRVHYWDGEEGGEVAL